MHEILYFPVLIALHVVVIAAATCEIFYNYVNTAHMTR